MPAKKEFKVSDRLRTTRITQIDENTIEVHCTTLGYPIKFTLTDELREFLRGL